MSSALPCPSESPFQPVAVNHANPRHSRYFVLNWNLGNTCNYQCSYCPLYSRAGTYSWPHLETVVAFADHVISHAKKIGKKPVFEFTGGEVTLFRDFIKICQEIRSRGAQTGVLSNGSPDIAYWKELASHLDFLCLTFHPEYASAEHFHQILEELSSRVSIHLNVVVQKSRADISRQFLLSLNKRYRFTVGLQFLNGPTDLKNEEEEEILANELNEIISKLHQDLSAFRYRGQMIVGSTALERRLVSASDVMKEQWNHWEGWKCWAGVDHLVVDKDGSIYRSWCENGGVMGNIFFPEELSFSPILCQSNSCQNVFDVMTKRQKPALESAPRLSPSPMI